MLSYVTSPSYPKGKATYAQIGGPDGFLANLEPFAGNSLHAHWEGETYVVYSYWTEIAKVSPYDGLVHLNLSKYSVTSSHHQGLVAAWLGHNVDWVQN